MNNDAAAPVSSGESQVPNGGVSPKRGQWLTSALIATTARVVFIVLALIAFAHLARAVVLPLLLAWVASMTLKTPVNWLKQCPLPTALAAAIVVGVFVASISFTILHLGRPAVEWLAAAPDNFPKLKTKFQGALRPAAQLSAAASTVENITTVETTKKATPVEVKDNRVAGTVFTWTGSLLAGAGETVALLFLLLASGDLFLLKLVRAMPTLRDKKQAVEISREIQQSISTYLFSVGLINIGFGVAVGLILFLLGMPNALMWGGVAAFANFIPYLGPILGIGAVGLAGLLAFDTLGRGLLPACAYLLLHLVESNVVTPFALGRRFALNPVVIFIALTSCASLWGVMGAFLSVPLLVTMQAVCDRVPALAFLSELLASHQGTESDSGEKADATSSLDEGLPAPTTPHAP